MLSSFGLSCSRLNAIRLCTHVPWSFILAFSKIFILAYYRDLKRIFRSPRSVIPCFSNYAVCRVWQNSTRSRACKAVFRPLFLINKKKKTRACTCHTLQTGPFGHWQAAISSLGSSPAACMRSLAWNFGSNITLTLTKSLNIGTLAGLMYQL